MSSDVVVVGDPAALHGRLGHYTVANSLVAKRFDTDSDTWTVTTGDGQRLSAHIVIDTTPDGAGVVAAHGLPNYFRIPGPHTARQARYVARLIEGMRRGGAARIEARSVVRISRLFPVRGLSRFYLSGAVAADYEGYDGPAVFTLAGRDHHSRVRLSGHFDPIDGQYHWQGMLFADLPGAGTTGSAVDIRIGEHVAPARISERTPWGTLSVVGAPGRPPFPMSDVEISMPPRR